MRPVLSVVCPVHNEAEVLDELYRRVVTAVEPVASPFEIVFVDDRSTDASLALLRRLAATDPRVRVVALSRNFGKQRALAAGIDHACGSAVVTLDADLQDPPELIPEMVRRWRAGADMVYGQRTSRVGETVSKRAFAKAFYRVIGRLSDTPLPHDAGDFRLMARKVVDALGEMREENRYYPGMVAWLGFRQEALPFERPARPAGRTKFRPGHLLRFAIDGITSFSDKPLRLSSAAGVVITGVSFLYAAWVVLRRLILGPDASIQGFPSLLVAVLFLGGVQLLSIGVLGEYIGRIYTETKRRPLYVVDELIFHPQAAVFDPAAAPTDGLGREPEPASVPDW